MNETQTILLVDDSPNDLLLMSQAFKKAGFNNPLKTVRNGEDVVAYLEGRGEYEDRAAYPLPIVMLLDLNMPKMNGFEVLSWVRGHPAIGRIMLIVLTASMRIEDVERAFDLGANSFLVKPASMRDLVAMIGCLRDWLHYNQFSVLD